MRLQKLISAAISFGSLIPTLSHCFTMVLKNGKFAFVCVEEAVLKAGY